MVETILPAASHAQDSEGWTVNVTPEVLTAARRAVAVEVARYELRQRIDPNEARRSDHRMTAQLLTQFLAVTEGEAHAKPD